jgi:hypothetical protein
MAASWRRRGGTPTSTLKLPRVQLSARWWDTAVFPVQHFHCCRRCDRRTNAAMTQLPTLESGPSTLSARELGVVQLLARRMSTAEIARAMSISGEHRAHAAYELR